jgi:hypothetical protein
MAAWLHGCMAAWLHGCMAAWLHGCCSAVRNVNIVSVSCLQADEDKK